jgi:hypothetical protein
MGFNNTATTITITAKLTPQGRERLLRESSAILSHFTLGDSDANYQTEETLTTGKIPTAGGDYGVSNEQYTAPENTQVRSKLYFGNTNATIKPVKENSFKVIRSINDLGKVAISGDSTVFAVLDRTNTSDDNTNYFKTLSLPITDDQQKYFNISSERGGWLDTAFSGFNTDNVLLASINKDAYGELIDGKNIKGELQVYTGVTTGGTPTGLTTFEYYSTFVNSSQYSKSQQDKRYSDGYVNALNIFGSNVAFLVSDNIQKPNNDVSKSWSTGYDTFKPFSVGNKSLINFQSNSTTGIVADKIIGIAYLDKGLLAFTDPLIVSGIATDVSSATTSPVGFFYFTGETGEVSSISTNVVQNIVCVADREEFYRSQNQTFESGDSVRITEIAITDITGQILAIGKSDRQVIKPKNDFVVFDVQIVV